MRQIITAITALFVSGLLLAGCGPDKEYLDEEVYKRLVAEFALLNQMNEEVLNGRDREEVRFEIFEYYGTTAEEFEISHNYYQTDIDAQLKRMEETSALLRSERDSIHDAERAHRQALEEVRLDTVNTDDTVF